MSVRVELVHAQQIAGEERRLVTTGAGADLHDRVAQVIRVLRDERALDGLGLGLCGIGGAAIRALRTAAKPTIGDKSNRISKSGTRNIASRAEHFLHTGAALGTFATYYDDIAFFCLTCQYTITGFFLAFEDNGRT